MARELVLICWDCRREMGRDDGYLWAHTGEVNLVHRESSKWTQRYANPDGGLSLTLDQALEQPEPAQWRVHHESCDGDRGDAHYRIPAAKLRIRADLLDWTAHLLEKNWLPYTDWREVIRETRTGGLRFAVPGPRPSSRRAV